MPSLISILDIYTGLKRVLPLLPPSAMDAVSSLLRAAPPELLRLCFLELHPGQPVEIHGNSVYAPAERREPADLEEGSDPAFWVVFERPPRHAAGFDAAAAAPAPSHGRAAQRDLAEVLEAFHFFAPLECTPEIRQIDFQLARHVAALQRLRQRCGAELHGEQLTLHSPVAISWLKPDMLRVTGLAPLDRPPCGHVRHPMAASKPYYAPVVVLSERSITLVPDPTVRLSRVR